MKVAWKEKLNGVKNKLGVTKFTGNCENYQETNVLRHYFVYLKERKTVLEKYFFEKRRKNEKKGLQDLAKYANIIPVSKD